MNFTTTQLPITKTMNMPWQIQKVDILAILMSTQTLAIASVKNHAHAPAIIATAKQNAQKIAVVN
jgi:hypothetical protein